MNDLDKKILSAVIGTKIHPESWPAIPSFVQKIKDAFVSEGWVHVPQIEVVKRWDADDRHDVITVDGKDVFTGRQWYQKFYEEMGGAVNECTGCSCDAMEAARRASGVDDE